MRHQSIEYIKYGASYPGHILEIRFKRDPVELCVVYLPCHVMDKVISISDMKPNVFVATHRWIIKHESNKYREYRQSDNEPVVGYVGCNGLKPLYEGRIFMDDNTVRGPL